MRSSIKTVGAGVSVLAAAMTVGGCAGMPSGPTVAVWPAPGKPFVVFQREDDACRAYARYRVSPDAANESAFRNAALGTAIGAAVGALLTDSSGGAGAGAGMGLLVGASSGSAAGAGSGWALQRQYDIAYEQCMYASGNQLPGAPAPRYLPPPPPPGGG